MNEIDSALEEIKAEHDRAISANPPFNSAHEGYSVILEELDELWDEIKKNQRIRSKDKMREEATQVAAMALRFMVDVCRKDWPL